MSFTTKMLRNMLPELDALLNPREMELKDMCGEYYSNFEKDASDVQFILFLMASYLGELLLAMQISLIKKDQLALNVSVNGAHEAIEILMKLMDKVKKKF